MGGGFKRYGLYHKTQGVPEEWAFDDRKKQIFGLLSRKKQIFGLLCSTDRKFAFSGRQKPILREHPVFCGTNHTVLAGHHTVDGMVLGGGPYRFRAAFS